MLEYCDYHTAVSGKARKLKKKSLFETKPDSIEAFVYELGIGNQIPESFRKADAIYIEPPWSTSFYKFDNTKNYDEFVSDAKRIIDELAVPAFVLHGKKDAMLWNPELTKQIDFVFHDNYKALIGVYNVSGNIPDFKTELEVAEYVISRYDCILDFCCGYGNTARWAVEYNKRCICTDISQKCIDYINGNS